MRSLIFAACAATAGAFYSPGFRADRDQFLRTLAQDQDDQLPAQWFTQRLDHFNLQVDRTWNQRYFVNDQYYQKGGPVFFQIGGEGAISSAYVSKLKYVDYAKDQGALLVSLEHRFYGVSQPTGDLSLESLQWLNSRQALADAAYFIETLLEDPRWSDHGPIVTFGGSYPGALSAWFRMKYPHIAKGAVASSAPVKAVLDMTTYLTDVNNALMKIMGEKCDAAYRSAFTLIAAMLSNSAGAQSLSSLFNTCERVPPTHGSMYPRDTSMFLQSLIGLTMGTVQYNRERRGMTTVTELCDVMLDESLGNPVNRLAAQFQKYGGLNGQCMDISYENSVAQLRNTSVGDGAGVGIRQWTYQTCTEFGYFQTTDGENQPFGTGVPLQLSLDLCKDGFSASSAVSTTPFNIQLKNASSRAVRKVSEAVATPDPTSPMSPRIDETNKLYGSDHPIGASRILYVNGGIDPWHTISITHNLTASLQAILIPGAAHCANMMPYVEGVTVEAVRTAQVQIGDAVAGFVAAEPQ